MNVIVRILIAILVPVVASMSVLPQTAVAHANDTVISQSSSTPKLQIPSLFSSLRSNAQQNISGPEAGLTVNPDHEASVANQNKPVAETSEARGSAGPAGHTTGLPAAAGDMIRRSGLDIDKLIEKAPALPDEGLVLTTARNTLEIHPLTHDELLSCVIRESFTDPDWFGSSLVSEVNHKDNIHGNDEYYISRYEAFFRVQEGRVGVCH